MFLRSFHVCAALALVAGFGGVAEAEARRGSSIRLPAARPQVEIAGEINPSEVIEPQNELLLFDPNDAVFGEQNIPPSVEAAVMAMQKALPREYRFALLAHYGLTRDGQPATIVRTDLRSVALSQFLYDRWAYAHPKSRLAKEFRCLVGFEGDISAFELLVAEQARRDLGDEEPIKAVSRTAMATYYAAAMAAGVALQACERLVRLGWSPHKGL